MKNLVILVHGIDDDAQKMKRMEQYLHSRGHTTLAVTLAPSSGEIGIDELALQLETVIKEKIKPAQKIDLVGFSMGGLICRYYVQRLNGFEYTDHLITLSSPHHGTWMGYFKNNRGALQMRPHSTFLQNLNRDIATLNNIKFTSIWTPFDLMIIPASSSRTTIGHQIKMLVLAHPLMVLDIRCLRVVEKELLR